MSAGLVVVGGDRAELGDSLRKTIPEDMKSALQHRHRSWSIDGGSGAGNKKLGWNFGRRLTLTKGTRPGAKGTALPLFPPLPLSIWGAANNLRNSGTEDPFPILRTVRA